MPVARHSRTALVIVVVLAAVLCLLALEIAGFASFSLGGNAIYNPMPGYGPLRMPAISSSSAAVRAAASSSVRSDAADEWTRARLERRLRVQQRSASRFY
jgi:hypothetical protein